MAEKKNEMQNHRKRFSKVGVSKCFNLEIEKQIPALSLVHNFFRMFVVYLVLIFLVLLLL